MRFNSGFKRFKYMYNFNERKITMSWIVKARTTLFDVCKDLFSLKSGDKNATPPNSSNDTVKHRAEVSTNDDEPKSLWSRL